MIMRDHAPRVEGQSHLEKERAKALRYLTDRGMHCLQRSEWRYEREPVVLVRQDRGTGRR